MNLMNHCFKYFSLNLQTLQSKYTEVPMLLGSNEFESGQTKKPVINNGDNRKCEINIDGKTCQNRTMSHLRLKNGPKTPSDTSSKSESDFVTINDSTHPHNHHHHHREEYVDALSNKSNTTSSMYNSNNNVDVDGEKVTDHIAPHANTFFQFVSSEGFSSQVFQDCELVFYPFAEDRSSHLSTPGNYNYFYNS